ncbi:MAG: glycosyltransferase [Anditalea sp.]
MMIYIHIAVIGLLIVQDFLLWVLTHSKFIDHSKRDSERKLPMVSVLVPARNEEMDLLACLKSLEKLIYPGGKIQFVIGDDQSKDNTPTIIQEWVSQGENRVFVAVEEAADPNKINGKANALSQMAKVADGDFYFYTDADCAVNPLWVMEMLGAYKPESGLIKGITVVRVTSLFSAMQGIDWWITLGMVKITSDLRRPMTGMGNNMMLSKKAYWRVGGFENTPFSVTEDFALAQALIAEGYHPIHQVSAESLVVTKSERSFLDLMKQRKRWMKGALSLPWYWLLLLALQCCFFPSIIYLILYYPYFGVGIWLIKIIIQSLFIREFAAKTETKVSYFHLLCFEFYYSIISWSTIGYYFWPSTINWKGRQYR